MMSREVWEKTLPTIQEAKAYDTVSRKRFACYHPSRAWGSECIVDAEEGADGCEQKRWRVPDNDSSVLDVDQKSPPLRIFELELPSFRWGKRRKHLVSVMKGELV